MLRFARPAALALVLAVPPVACRARQQGSPDAVADSAAQRMTDSGAVRDVIGRPEGSDAPASADSAARPRAEPKPHDFKPPERRPPRLDSVKPPAGR